VLVGSEQGKAWKKTGGKAVDLADPFKNETLAPGNVRHL